MSVREFPDIRQYAPFTGLPPAAARFLQARLAPVHYAAGETIVIIGQRGHFWGLVEHGHVLLKGPQGENLSIGAGEAFGDAMLRFGVPSAYTALAHEDTTLWVLRRSDWLAARQETIAVSAQPSPRRRPNYAAWLVLVAAVGLMAFYWIGPALLDFTQHQVTDWALRAGREELAENFLTLALRYGWLPGDAWNEQQAKLYASLGYVLTGQGRSEEALEAFQQAVNLDEESASTQNNLGVALLNQSKAELAREHLQAAVSLDPGNAVSWYNLGNANLAIGDRQAAALAYQRALELDPTLVDARVRWASLALMDGRRSLARQAWQQALVEQPDHPLARRGLGALAVLEGAPEKALPDLLIARSSDPTDPMTRFYLALALEALNRPQQAAEQFQVVLSLSSDPALLQQAQAHLLSLQQPSGSGAAGGKEGSR